VHYAALREEAHKSWQYIVSDEIVYLPETISVLNEAVGIDGRIALAEIYRNGNAWIELQFGLVGDRDTHYQAVIEALNRDEFCRAWGNVNEDFTSVSRNPPVLVEVTHSIQPPERVRFVGCPSVIRLKRFDLVDGFIGNSDNLVAKSLNDLFGSRHVAKDGKLNGRRRTGNGQLRQTPKKLIESGAHAVKGISDDQARSVGHVIMLEPKDVSLLCKIIITVKSIRLSFSDEPLKFDIESLKMHLRPTKFQIGIE